MKAVLALLLVCLVQISSAEQEDISGDASSEGNLSLQREVRDAARGCDKGDEKCNRKMRKSRQEKKRKNRRKVKKSKKGKKAGKRGGNGGRKKLKRKLDGQKNKKKEAKGSKKKQNKNAKDEKKGQKKNSPKNRRKGKKNGPLRTSSTSGNGRQDLYWTHIRQDQCFTDLVAKTKKFNKAQVEFRLAKRVESWGKLMKNKKNNSASTFGDALEAMNDATGNGESCEGDSSSLEEAKKVQQKLANCATTAGDNCDEGKLSVPINSTLVSSCKTPLENFTKDFKECLTKATDAEICTCVQGLTNPGDECLDFKAMHDGVKAQKDKCTKGSEEGSFGDCRKQERMAAKFGNKCKKSCSGPSVTTQAPAASQRMKLLRRLNQKLNFL